jgi:hypothetical protein
LLNGAPRLHTAIVAAGAKHFAAVKIVMPIFARRSNEHWENLRCSSIDCGIFQIYSDFQTENASGVSRKRSVAISLPNVHLFGAQCNSGGGQPLFVSLPAQKFAGTV